jgi:hypothetical protein
MVHCRGVFTLALLGLSYGGCAAGNQAAGTGGSGGDTTTTTTSTTTTTTSMSSSSSGGGSGGVTSSSSGSGGTTSSGGGGSGGTTSSSGGGGSGGGGGPPTETALAYAGSAVALLGGEYHPDGTWTVSLPGVGTSHRPAVALLDAQTGVALHRSAMDGALLFSKWSAGTFSSPIAIGNLAKAADAPAMVTWNGAAAVAYHGTDFKHYFAIYQGPMAGWSPTAEPILANNVHSFGPSAPALAIVDGEVVVVYAGNNGNLYDQKRVAGAWEGANGHGVDGTIDLTPTIIELPLGGSEALVCYVRKTDTQVMFTLRSAGIWTAPQPVPDVYTNAPVALASAFGDGAVLAFKGTNAMLYTSTYKPADNPPWSTPKAFGSATSAEPALALGIGGADAEMVFVNLGKVRHARLIGGVWSAATDVGGVEIDGVALATFSP